MNRAQRIGILTGGGDAPGLNAVIESCTSVLRRAGVEVQGVADGFEGIFRQELSEIENLTGLHAQAGSILGTSNRSRLLGRESEFLKAYQGLGLDGLLVCGGDGTFTALRELRAEIPMIGLPKTIDNDLGGTERSLGYDTACSVVAESAEALRASASAHRRIFLLETMGRNAGWIALGGGLAAMADVILIPERPYSREGLRLFLRGKKTGQRGLIMVVAEGVAFEGGSSNSMARWLEKEVDWEVREVVLGHMQRCRPPTSSDRIFSISLGVKAAQLILTKSWGQALAYQKGEIVPVDLENFMGEPVFIPSHHPAIAAAQSLGLFI